MTDFEVLGIDKPFSMEDLKKAYRDKSKCFHPDRNEDNLTSHLAMIRLNLAYSNLKSQLTNEPVYPEKQNPEDTAYAIYKDGVQRFQNIHPSRWKSFSMNLKSLTGASHARSDTPDIIQNLIREMAMAYTSFTHIVNDHENSPWYADSLAKMKEIEKMTLRYVKIKDSYEREQNI